ncbi:DR2241 family protein [Rubrobacter aplysinae]|uniref:DR2241 family protein n=1 Tax=Rubrobacter aplysinae TaxID=909625 RepID=UPI00069F2834|nr:DR2241 family protein [Rubrobacter aplysinae]
MHPASPDPARTRPLARRAREAFSAWVSEEPAGRVFAQVLIRRVEPDETPSGPTGGGYELRHADDVDRLPRELNTYEDPRQAREIAKLTETGEYRPLKSAPNLRRGWLLRLADEEGLSAAMGYLYPAAVVHWYLERAGELQITSYRENAARQTGIYQRIQSLSDAGVKRAARACCEDSVCLKRTLWDVDEHVPLDMDRGGGEIPCPEPCSVFVSFARRVRAFEREEERDLADSTDLTASERGDLAALVEAASTGDVRLAREAEFEEPLNERRMRYRSQTLTPKLQPPGDEGDGE